MIDAMNQAARIIGQGGTIAYPTDTIWGIGCDATQPMAVEKIYQIKRRSDRKSMLVLMNDPGMLHHYLHRVPEQAIKLIMSAEKPTTIIYPGSKNFAANLPAEDGSIGIRITSDPFCVQLIQMIGKPIVSTSANISGQSPPKTFLEISDEILRQVDYVVPWRQKERKPAAASSIIRLDENGETTMIRP
jgi:L-threonylcarbamoyladenylate synthase